MSNTELPSKRLKLYLINDKYSNYDSIIKDLSTCNKTKLDKTGVLYYKNSEPKTPYWLSDFFLNHQSINTAAFLSSTSSAVFITKVKHRSKERFFAIPFGSGRYLLKDFAIENRFGLITTLNILEAKGIRSIGKTTLSSNPKMSNEQISIAGTANEFQINIERDLVDSITGRSTNPDFGNLITGKDAISVNSKVNINNLHPFLVETLKIFEKKDYKKDFKWIDQIKEVKEEKLIDQLNLALIDGINDSTLNVWLAVPEMIEWESFLGFKYSTRKTDDLHEELDLDVYLTDKKLTGRVSLDDLFDDAITLWTENKDTYRKLWTVYNCLNAEIEIGKDKYLLDKGKWFRVESSFVKEVEKEFNSLDKVSFSLLDYNHKDENDYNVELAKSLNALCLDAKNLQYGGGASKIEVCDILTLQKQFFHVKKFGGSASLSHLFAQGFVSAELFVTDPSFRNAIRKTLISSPYDTIIPKNKPKAEQYTIIYLIIKSSKKHLNIPFFSKVNLKNFKRVLEAYGYNIQLGQVKDVAPPSKAAPKKNTGKTTI